MIYAYILAAIAAPIILFAYLGYAQDKANRLRYEPILHRLKQGRRYPYWWLEEMLDEERVKK